MPLHDPSWYPTCVQSFSPVSFTVFELQGLKLKNKNNNNNNNNKKNCKNELPLIFHTSPMQMWILIETESDIEIFQMYGIDGAGPAPSL